MSARLNVGSVPIAEPAARLDRPGLAIVYLTDHEISPASFLSFTTPQAARELAAACSNAAELLGGPQLVPVT
jgi:hypothetical protein